MANAAQTGVFGKLPAHGDFIRRDLPVAVVNVWDEWLQHFIAATKEQIGENWLETYLTSPIWRFVFSVGVVNDAAWAGILLSSVDRVGRYFPFTVMTRLPEGGNPLDMLVSNGGWFDSIESVSLQALEGQLTVDELTAEFPAFGLSHNEAYARDSRVNSGAAVQVDLESDDRPATEGLTYLLDSFLADSLSSYGVWSTTGSERVAPCLFATKGLPRISGVAAMLDGQWQQWNWRQPYRLNTTPAGIRQQANA
jgi:type VI secretion system protein ImpM